ncbi:retinoic acid-induced protein 1-like [Conger conger]|uniref:retinoic acid-induced protein 1-like n=1 Tax=Conger conger TaxID=82655 RepID=UPI002A59C33F|nr:retinoic acid-induced protein 1-like [Conger conger]
MQSFRERSGFRGNQHCHQQEPYELSRLENYRHHHSQNRQGYEAHSLSVAATAAAAGAGAKDCYGQQAYPGYGSNSASAEKQYKRDKMPSQHLQGGYSSHLNTAYSTQYVNEGHLQQKWEDSSHMSQYEQNMLGRLESTGGAVDSRSQFLPQNILAISQNQCSHVSQPSTPVYTSHHQQKLPQDTTPSAMTYSHGHLHFPQHTQSLGTSTPSYIEKCNVTPHCYKGYPMPPNSQYNRQLGNSNSLKQSSYRTQNNYAYQQPPSRTGYEQQSPLQGIPSTQDSLSKYQHFSQPQQNYCLSDISVRSPEQYYQNCSPNASHSPVRSVGRSPSYNPTSSPLMVNSETFLYSQPPITSGASSSSSLREQGLHIPQQSQPSPSVNHQTTSYAGSLKDKFSEKLLSNPSLWSLNALTSQVENISNNVQQLLLSEALIANKKGSKRNNPKQEEDFKGQLHTLEDSSCLDTQDTAPVPEAFSTSPNIQSGLQEGRCPNSSEDQQESSYYYCRQSTSPTQATTNAQHTLDMVPSCVMTSPSDMSSQSEASHRPAQAEGDNLNTILKELRAERSPISISVPASLNQEQNSPADSLGDSAKENFEESAWSEKVEEKEREGKVQLLAECEKQDDVTACKQEEEWAGEEKCLSVLHEISDAPSDNNYPNDKDEKMYQDLVQDYSPSDGDINDASRRRDTGCDAQPETYKSEFPPDLDATGKRVPFVWGDEYISMKDDELELPHVSSRSQLFEGRLSSASKVRLQADEEQHAVLSSQAAEVSKEESLPSSEVINNITWSLESGEFLSPAQEQGSKSPAKPEVQDTDQVTISEKRSDICDITPLTNSVKTVFSVFNEEATPPSQARERIDQCEAVVPEPESPQLPGKSMMHSAPSWADTPPSPKKGDEEIDPGISCPSAVTPSTKSEPMATSAKLRVFNRKHVRGRRRQPGMLMHTSVRIRRLSSAEGDSVPAPPQDMGLPPSKAMVFVEQARAAHKDLSSQTPTLLTENIPSRMCTRSFTAMATPKTCLRLKRQPCQKPSNGGVVKDSQCDPKGLISKIKWRKQRGPKPMVIGHRKGRRGLSENRQQDENQETTLCLSPCVKAQRPMVLRSRKQTQENPLKEKAKERKTMCILPKALKEIKRQRTAFLKEQDCVSSKQNLASVHQKGVYRTLLSKSEKSVSSIKRKSSCHSPLPVRKQRGVKGIKPEILQPPLKTKLMGVKGPKKRLMQGENFNIPLRSFLAKDPSPVDINDIPCISPQYPAKTKYLPPRKGRGLKYEAMVQKITSPGSKKHIANPQVENVQGNVMTRTTLQGSEQAKTVQEGEVVPEQQEIRQNIEETQDSTVDKASVIKQRKKLSTESGDQPELASGSESLVINTPRLAKQRAIKNNHEMHLKQRRKRRKGLTPLESTVEQETPTPTSALPAGEQIALTLTPTHISMCKKARCATTPTKKRQAKAMAKQGIKNKTIIQKAGSNQRKNIYLHNTKPTKNGWRLKTRHRLQANPVVEGQQPEICLKYVMYKPQKIENKPFSPYVYIDSSEELASFCAIVNKPEEELLLQAREKRFPKIQNPVTAAKVIPNSSVMLQGPLVNKNLIDRCLSCCLCGKPANYRELGDLCGPYYPEDSIPRKAMSFKYKVESRDERVTVNCSAVQANTLKRGGVKSLTGGSSGNGRPGRPKKTDKVSGETATIRPRFLERYKKLQQSQSYERRVGEEGAAHSRLQDSSGATQKQELEVEAKENWVHEACAVWTSGVFLVAGKLYGLKEAMSAASEMSCSKCQDVGASVSCCSKGCHQKFHYVCAKESGCLLLEESFSLKCTKHKAL